MSLTTGANHLALVTADLDRLIDFYASVFDADVVMDMVEGDLRHAMIDLGGGFALHPFHVGENPHAETRAPMFGRGHLDHLALNVVDTEQFETIRRRLVERGASDGTVTDFGTVRTVTFTDPDGWEGEIAQWQEGEPLTFEERIQEPFAVPVGGRATQ